MAYKRKRSGAYIGGRRSKRRLSKRRGKYSRGRIYGGSRGARGTKPKFLFHRWVAPALPVYSSVANAGGVNFSSSQGVYSSTTGILGVNTGQTELDCSIAFSFGDINNIVEFTTLFDQYKLNCVVLTLKMINVPEQTDAANLNIANFGNFYPTIWYAPDHDDNNYLTITQLKEYERVKHKVLRPNKEFSVALRPTTLQQVYNTSATTGYACNFKKPWLDMSQTGIPHYGIKFCIDLEGLTTGTAPAQGFQFKVQAKYYFSCKNVR